MIVESYEDVIVLSGVLRHNFWETIHTAISLILKRHPTGVIIDCSGITEATPAGAETFRDAMEFIRRHDARIILAAVPESFEVVLRSVPEVRSQLPIVESVEEARRSLDILAEPDEKRRKKLQAKEGARKIIVCLTGNGGDERALLIGSQIADSVPSEIHIVFVVLVPRDLPLQAALPQQEEKAAAAIEYGKSFLHGRQLPYTPHLIRGRDIASALEDVLEEIDARLLIVPLSKSDAKIEDNAKLMKSVLTKVKKEVVFVRGD